MNGERQKKKNCDFSTGNFKVYVFITNFPTVIEYKFLEKRSFFVSLIIVFEVWHSEQRSGHIPGSNTQCMLCCLFVPVSCSLLVKTVTSWYIKPAYM